MIRTGGARTHKLSLQALHWASLRDGSLFGPLRFKLRIAPIVILKPHTPMGRRIHMYIYRHVSPYAYIYVYDPSVRAQSERNSKMWKEPEEASSAFQQYIAALHGSIALH